MPTDPNVPRVGLPSTDYRAVCQYSHQPGAPECTNEATVHVATEDAHYGFVCLASCNEHAPIARASGRYVMEHTFEGVCGLPGTLWNEQLNRCVLDDSGEEPALHAHATVGSSLVIDAETGEVWTVVLYGEDGDFGGD